MKLQLIVKCFNSLLSITCHTECLTRSSKDKKRKSTLGW